MNSQLDWLVHETKISGDKLPKTIIFCNTLNDIASVVNVLLLKLGSHAYIPVGSNDSNDFIVGIFHSASWPNYKEKLLNDFKMLSSKKIIIVASSALSMGVDFPDIRYVVNWGPARNLLDQLQEAGRAGRDGKLSHVITIYHGNQLSHCEDEIKDFVKTTGCYRVAAYKQFDSSIAPIEPGHDCCLHCSQECCCVDCGNGAAFKYPFEDKPPEHGCDQTLSRPVSDEDRKDLQAALTEISLGQRNHSDRNAFDASNYFSLELVDDIVNRCQNLFTIQDIVASNLPVYSVAHSLKILEVIQAVFEDIPNLESSLDFFSQLTNCSYEYESTNKDMQSECYFLDYVDSSDDNTDLL